MLRVLYIGEDCHIQLTNSKKTNKAAAARAIGISRVHLYRILNGEGTPSLPLAERTAAIIGGKVDDYHRPEKPKGRPPINLKLGANDLSPLEELNWKKVESNGAINFVRVDAERLKRRYLNCELRVWKSDSPYVRECWGEISHKRRHFSDVHAAIRAVDKVISPLSLRRAHCAICGAQFKPRRIDAVTCGPTCRKRRQRAT